MSVDTAWRASLEEAWHRPRTFYGYLTAVQHRSLGARFVATGLVFFLLAGIAAILMRIQLAVPEAQFLDAELYNQIFTMHGTTMMFLFAVPIAQGIGIYIVPMMIGARDMAFPRLNAFGYWVYFLGGTALWVSLFFGQAPNSGWFNYPTLGTARYQAGMNIDVYALTISMVEIAAIVAAIELVVTVLKLRAPGMSLNRMPLFVWAQLVMGVMILAAMPTVLVATLLLELDNMIGTHFYSPGGGGDPLLWQHLFWFFGHPEVYIILLPGLGIVAAVVATFTRHDIVGYPYVAAAFVAIGMLSFAVWVHHMFATGRATTGMGLFSVATFAVVIPSGVQMFATLATMAYGRLRMSVPMLYVLGFVFVFILGGLTGVNVASIPFDLQVHDTYFVVAHFHYVLLGGMLFPLFAGLYYWFPKFTGRMLDDRLGKLSFWVIFVGMNVTFFPMHLLGLWAMPRRVYTYLPGLGWDRLNLLATIGAGIFALGVATYLFNAVRSVLNGPPAPADPWGAGTLEWSIASPPPVYGFARTPVVDDRNPLWRPRTDVLADAAHDLDDPRLETSFDRRETMATSLIDAVPQFRAVQQTSTIVPFLAALAVAFTFLSALIEPLLILVGLVLVAFALFVWFKPDPQEWDRDWLRAGPEGSLPTSFEAARHGYRSTTWAGGLVTVLVSASVFVTLIVSYLYLRVGHDVWPIDPVEPRALAGPLLASLPLIASVVPLGLARRAIARDDHRTAGLGLLAAGALALLFGVLKVVEYVQLDQDPRANVSASLDWTLTGFHLLYVLAFVVAAVVVGIYTLRGLFHGDRPDGVTVTAMFGGFVALVWIPLFAVVYLGHALM